MKYFLLLLLVTVFAVCSKKSAGQGTDSLKRVTGVVKDDQNLPLQGVSVQVKNSTAGTITNDQGTFGISVPSNTAVLVFSAVGYRSQEITVGSALNFDITMLLTADSSMDEVVVVGYGTQKKSSLTGAVSSIKGEDIRTTKNENPQNMLTGKVPGVRIVQKTAEPGAFNNAFDIRGFGSPLIIIDGVPRSNADFQRMNANDIENISVLKDASAAIYGVRSANGVVLITTKKGKNNESILSYDGSFMWQFPSGLPKTVDIYEYMTLRNEAAMHNINGGSPVYNDQAFEDYRSGKKKSYDWYPLVFAKSAPQTQHNLSVTGGNEKIQYYVGGGYLNQSSFFQTNDLNYNKYNLRTSVTAKVGKRFTLDANINLVSETINQPYQSAWWIIRGFWRQGPHIPAYANDDPTRPYHGLIEGDNPISFMDKDINGYRVYKNSWVQPVLSLRYDIPGVTGLYAKTLFSYDYSISNRNYYQKEYKQYRYDETTKEYATFTRQSPDRVTREAYFYSQLLSQTSLNYNRVFNNRHQVDGALIWEVQKREGDNFIAQRDLALQLPYLFAGISLNQQGRMSTEPGDFYENANVGLAGRLNYAFNNKYLAEFLFRYDGSSKFAGGYQWGFFPGASVGWRISEEPFFKNATALSFVKQLKLRASYGTMGDDGASAYQWAPGYVYPSNTDTRNFTGGYVFDGNFVASANNKGIINPSITWFTSKSFDAGIDFVGWNGLLGITFDYFNRRRDGLLSARNGGIPTVVGAALPEENLNSDLNYGYDFQITHNNNIGEMAYSLSGIFSYARIKALYVERGPNGSSYSNWRNNQNDRLQNIWWGYTGDGRYESWEEIWNSPVYVGRGTLPGDYRYEDWNGDGEINDLDRHPYQLSSTPWINYGFSASFSYKGIDLFFLLQGSALSTVQYVEQLYQPLWGNSESGAMVQFMDRWHPKDPKADPYDPKTEWIPGYYGYTGTLPDAGSSYNSVNGAYLRLKSVELGYSLPEKWLKRLAVKNTRFYVNAYNLLTFTKVRYIDPEHPSDTYGYLYPLNKTVSVGLNVTF
ncbi:SusC/RagA family TonB-linked outer membrane protein [Niabella beijingensis]|uniref:SusC/RagA family TonB-linked outer membrane protein n=1 Tax=Niabella beijingensis TaxID=2872700 RepID=UPI001CBEE70D|nr:TonB-dependent receptor [Niabella beijingensis]MBZ4187355.1 TonB-dependent receptor [Niabella beijingensis]